MHPQLNDLWSQCLDILRDNLPKEQFETWFQPITAKSFVDNKLTLYVPSAYYYEQIEERYFRILKPAIQRVFGQAVQLFYHFDVQSSAPETGVNMRSEAPNTASGLRKSAQPEGEQQNPFTTGPLPDFDSQLNPRYSFENYCEGTSNRVAMAIGQSIADHPEVKTFNPLFVFGPTGVGKTHLMQAIGLRIKEHNPALRVLYVTSRLFESQYTTAVRQGRVNGFIRFYQGVDVLIIDDIQDLIGKSSTQNTFFFIFNHLHQNQKQLILSSDCRPSSMEGMEERLLSRFRWGMTVELEKPDLALRREVLRRKWEQDGLEIQEDVLEYIAENVTESIRDLDGITASLVGHATALNRPVTIDLARRVVANAVKINRKSINFEMITATVTDFYSISPDVIFTKNRSRDVADARKMIMFLAKKHMGMSLKSIGARLSRNHATVIYGIQTVEERMSVDREFSAEVTALEDALLK